MNTFIKLFVLLFVLSIVVYPLTRSIPLKANELSVDMIMTEIRDAIHLAAQIGFVYAKQGKSYAEVEQKINRNYGPASGRLPNIASKYTGEAQ